MQTAATTSRKIYSATDYLEAAARVERLTESECHHALFAVRQRYADALRRTASTPNERKSVMVLTGIALYVYTNWFAELNGTTPRFVH